MRKNYLLFALCAALCSCGGNTQQNNSDSEPADTVEEVAALDEEPETVIEEEEQSAPAENYNFTVKATYQRQNRNIEKHFFTIKVSSDGSALYTTSWSVYDEWGDLINDYKPDTTEGAWELFDCDRGVERMKFVCITVRGHRVCIDPRKKYIWVNDNSFMDCMTCDLSTAIKVESVEE